MSMPSHGSVSVVIPAYNREAYVQEAVRSALNQGNAVGEVVVVDDDSKDETLAAARAVEDPRVRVLHQPNGGPSSARNRGWREARGRWVFFLDSDDALSPNALPDLLQAVSRDNGLQVPYGTQEVLGERLDGPVYLTAQLSDRSGNLFPQLATHYRSTIFNALFPRPLIDSIGGFDERIWYYEDVEFALRIALRAEFLFVPRPVYRARMHGTNRHRTFPEQAFDQRLEFTRRIFSTLPGSPRNRLLCRRAIAHVLWERASQHLHNGAPPPARRDLIRALILCPWKLAAWRLLLRSLTTPASVAAAPTAS